MIAGRREAELGGSPEFLDVVGINFYADNQWVHEGVRIAPGEAGYRAFREILVENHARYGRPIIVTETGSEGVAGANWMVLIGDEISAAMADGVPIAGCCIYPIMDYPGWTDDRHCRCGPISVDSEWTVRHLDLIVGEALVQFQKVMPVEVPSNDLNLSISLS